MMGLIRKIIMYIPKKIRKRLLGGIVTHDYRIKFLEIIVNQLARKTLGLEFQGQVGQDIVAYAYFNGKEDGFYIDIGANDGKTLSNTFVFENIGWNGICVEPLPDAFKQLRKNRRCDCFNVALANTKSNSAEFIRASGVEMLSGLNEQMTEVHKKRIISENGKIEKINVETLTFDGLMSGYSEMRHIDFMSIDVEGAEMSILEAIDFTKFSFGLITVENNNENKGGGERLKKYMEKQGYKVYLDLGLDMMFIPKNISITAG